MEEDSSDLDVEEMAMITRKVKKFFKKVRRIQKEKNSANSRTLIENSS